MRIGECLRKIWKFVKFLAPTQARSWVSPVFLSTAHGRVMPGLPVIDANTPLLLVGNHQLLLEDKFSFQLSCSLAWL